MTSAVHDRIRNVSRHVVDAEYVGISPVIPMSLWYCRTCANLFTTIRFCTEFTARLTGDVAPSRHQYNPQERLILPETSRF